MRREVFPAIAAPTCGAILSLRAKHTVTRNAVAAHSESSHHAVSKDISMLTENNLPEHSYQDHEIYYHRIPPRMK